MSSSFSSVVGALWSKYKETPSKLKLVDVYLAYILLTGAIQFLYCVLVGTFPFNSFLSGFISCVASFVLTVSLRMQIDPQGIYKGENQERAFADWLFANAVLHLSVLAFLG